MVPSTWDVRPWCAHRRAGHAHRDADHGGAAAHKEVDTMTAMDLAARLLELVNDRDDEGVRRLLKTGAEISLGDDGPRLVYARRADIRRLLRQVRRVLPQYTVAADHITETERGAVVDWEAIGTGAGGEVVESVGTLALEMDGDRIARIQAQPRDTRVIVDGHRLIA
jgi:hypothetical protein